MPRWLQVTVTSEQRTSFGTGGERAYLTHSHPYLPGSVLRGALAGAWLREGGNGTEFQQVFEAGRFGPALPAWVDVEPQSVGRCKYHQGSAHDEYIDYAFNPDSEHEERTHCAARERLKGSFTRSHLVTRVATALEPRTNTAAESQLFARELIEKGTRFVGQVVLDDSVGQSALGKLTTVTKAFFGGRSSILGRCEVAWSELDGAPGTEKPNNAQPVVLRTLSPTILVDDAGLPSTDFAAAIQALVGLAPVKTWADRMESGLAGGWHAASGLPKPTEMAVVPGAVARLPGLTREQLSTLLDHGVGLRRNEGYGWLEVVPKAWTPPTAKRTAGAPVVSRRVRSDEAGTMLEQIRALKLSAEQQQWFANKLRRVRARNPEGVEAAMQEAGAARLTPAQEQGSQEVGLVGVRELLEMIPDSVRQSIASTLTKGNKG